MIYTIDPSCVNGEFPDSLLYTTLQIMLFSYNQGPTINLLGLHVQWIGKFYHFTYVFEFIENVINRLTRIIYVLKRLAILFLQFMLRNFSISCEQMIHDQPDISQ